ncbi:hypothetical protein [Caminibacter pacificus]|jgi:hypothetical protein
MDFNLLGNKHYKFYKHLETDTIHIVKTHIGCIGEDDKTICNLDKMKLIPMRDLDCLKEETARTEAAKLQNRNQKVCGNCISALYHN